MADTIHIHGVSAQDVLQTLPVNTVSVTATSSGLNFGIIDGFVERAAGQVNAQLVRHGMEPTSLDPNSTQIARDAIIAYAAAQALERMGGSAEQIERRLREWRDLTQLLRQQPQVMGAAQDAASAQLPRSNVIPGADRRASSWRGDRTRW